MGVEPAFPFGHGLTYTSFAYSDIAVTAGGSDGAVATITATVTNTGPARAGSEVAQLYLSFPAEAGEPPLQLKGIAATGDLSPGEAAAVNFLLRPRDVSYFDETSSAWARCGAGSEFTARVGGSSRSLPLTVTFTA